MKIKCPLCGYENYFTDLELENEGTIFCCNCNSKKPLVEPKIPEAKENSYIKIDKGETDTTIDSKKTLNLLTRRVEYHGQARGYLLKKPFDKTHFFSKDWFFALWQGKRPLWEAWWVSGVAVYMVYSLFLVLPSLFQLSPSYYFVLPYICMFLQIFLWVTAWRCAPNVYNKAWFYLARFLILVGAFNFLSNSLKGF